MSHVWTNKHLVVALKDIVGTDRRDFAKRNRMNLFKLNGYLCGDESMPKWMERKVILDFTAKAVREKLNSLGADIIPPANYDEDETLTDLKAGQSSSGVNARVGSQRTSNGGLGFGVSDEYL